MLYHNEDPVKILAIEADAIDNEEHQVTLRDISETHRAYQLVILHVDQEMDGDKLCCSHQGEKVCSILRIQGKYGTLTIFPLNPKINPGKHENLNQCWFNVARHIGIQRTQKS